MSESEIKKCPKCSGEMEIGYLFHAAYWTRGKKMLKLGFGPRVFAYKCKNCRFIEFYAEKYQEKKE